MENEKQNKNNSRSGGKNNLKAFYITVIVFIITVELFKSYLKVICIFPYIDSHSEEILIFPIKFNFKIPSVLVIDLVADLIHEGSTLIT